MATTMKLIAKQTLGSNTATITLDNIPSGFDDLLLLCSLRYSTGTANSARIRFNGATSDTNHSSRYLIGNGNTSSAASATQAYCLLASPVSSAQTANTFTSCEVYIPNYAGSTNKSYSSTDVFENNGAAGYQTANAGLWTSTAAITKMEFSGVGGSDVFATNSSVYLYGIKRS